VHRRELSTQRENQEGRFRSGIATATRFPQRNRHGPNVIDPERDALDVRPTAEEMLARIHAEMPSGRGRLRLYLGMAPGVGKTYKMLEEGHRRVARGTDLVVGFAETHGRAVVAALLDGLEVVPRRRIEYRGVVVEEMDTDAVIARHPTVALIDELAHTNVPGSEREKRWQDVEAIRDAGIHVVTTMNVQHLESVADAVATITGAPVNERLPDDVLLGADEIELVDMSPHALRQRMRHGNVYPPERTTVALEKFFTEANLTALRELALRYVARRVEGQVEGAAADRLPLVTERVLVLVDGTPASMRAIRRAAHLAAALHGALVAVVVDTPAADHQPFDRSRDLQEAIDDAVDLGAEVQRIEAPDVATGVERVARIRRATHLVVPHHELKGLRRLTERTLVDRILERLPDLEVHTIGPAAQDGRPQPRS
jgi:two-component system sensor histidine kinase KdpD